MDDWLQTLLGTALIGGMIGITAHQYKKAGYNEAMELIAKNAQDQEIAKLRQELNELKRLQGGQNV